MAPTQFHVVIYHHGKGDRNGIWDQLLLFIVFPMLQNTRNFFLDRASIPQGQGRLGTYTIQHCDIPSWKGDGNGIWDQLLLSIVFPMLQYKVQEIFFRIELLQGQAFPHRPGRLGAYTQAGITCLIKKTACPRGPCRTGRPGRPDPRTGPGLSAQARPA